MSKIKNTIEINGQRYNATTGEPLTRHGSPLTKPSTSHAKPPEPRPKQRHTARAPAHHRRAHPTANSRTLMRQAVKKPGPVAKYRLRAQGNTDALVQRSLPMLTTKLSVLQIDEKRLRHARQVKKSRLVSRFSAATMVVAPPAAVPQTAKTEPIQPPASRPPHPTEALLKHALEQADSYRELPTAKHRRLRFKRRHAHAGSGT
jgi:hypothetical protein